MTHYIHPAAIISPESDIAQSVTVGPYAIIDNNVIIGEGSSVGSHAHVFPYTRIGKKCQLYQSCSVGQIPQDLKFQYEDSLLTVDDSTVIREFVTINRGTSATGSTSVGKNCLLMAYSHVAHDCHIGNNVILANAVQLAGHVTIDDFAGIGGMVPVHQFVKIGKYAFIGGGYRVNKDVPPYVLAAGEPLKFAGLNYTGLKRNGFSQEQIKNIDKAFFILYRSGLNTSAALNRIREDLETNTETEEIIRFIENSERGVIKK